MKGVWKNFSRSAPNRSAQSTASARCFAAASRREFTSWRPAKALPISIVCSRAGGWRGAAMQTASPGTSGYNYSESVPDIIAGQKHDASLGASLLQFAQRIASPFHGKARRNLRPEPAFAKPAEQIFHHF